jgi:hypothetical protein
MLKLKDTYSVSDFYGDIAQLVEQILHTDEVGGS